MILDFYKNNIIHFYLTPSLVLHVLGRQGAGVPLREHVAWWLDLFRWEFALPERDELTARIENTVAHLRDISAIDAVGEPMPHVIWYLGDGILENFRESYWIVAKTLLDLPAEGMLQRAAIARMQQSFSMHLLLGEIRKPEGNSAVTFGNALNRFTELNHVRVERRGRGGRESVLLLGEAFDALAPIERRLAESLSGTVAPFYLTSDVSGPDSTSSLASTAS
jgi:glycerol-3-phosphate O-acyltransferase